MKTMDRKAVLYYIYSMTQIILTGRLEKVLDRKKKDIRCVDKEKKI